MKNLQCAIGYLFPFEKLQKASMQMNVVDLVKKFQSEGYTFEEAKGLAELKLKSSKHHVKETGYRGTLGFMMEEGFKRGDKIDNRDILNYKGGSVAAANVILSNGVKAGVLRRVAHGVYRFN